MSNKQCIDILKKKINQLGNILDSEMYGEKVKDNIGNQIFILREVLNELEKLPGYTAMLYRW